MNEAPSFVVKGAQLTVTYQGQTTRAVALLASDNHQSAMLGFDAMLGGYLGMMPILWNEQRGIYLDLIVGAEVTVEARS